MSLELKWSKAISHDQYMEFCKKLENKNNVVKAKYATYIENNDPGSTQDIMVILNKILERLDRVETNQQELKQNLIQTNIKVDNIDKNQQEMRDEFNNRIDNIVMMNNLKE